MSLLPRILVVIFFTLFTLTLTPSAFAQGAPDPQPCKNPIQDEFSLTDNYITDDEGKALSEFRWVDGDENNEQNSFTVEGAQGEQVFLPAVTFIFRIDFSKLQALFANTNSNFLEGKFQTNEHRFANITELNSQDFNIFHGGIQKLSPKILTDEQKKNYVKYIYEKPTLPEAENKYTDINGAGDPKMIYDLVNEFGQPDPPTFGGDQKQWLTTWGKYWEKIPTAWSEFYEGEIAFHYVVGNKGLEMLKKPDPNNPEGTKCPLRAGDAIKIVLPEFYRTTATSDQVNRLLLARAAQSYQEHDILTHEETAAETNRNPISKAFRLCWELIKNPSASLKKVVPISFDFLNPIKIASAQEVENKSCLKPLNEGEEGTAPYCPLPFEEANKPGVTCSNKNDPNKLETDNPNVICTFTRVLSGTFVIIDPNSTPDKNPEGAMFDSCEDIGNGRYRCKVPLQIFPNIRIPWLAAIWNNSLYSDQDKHPANEKTGRPGFFGAFTPLTLRPDNTNMSSQELYDFCHDPANEEVPLCQELERQFEKCFADSGFTDYSGCLLAVLDLPANTPDAGEKDPKLKFMGAVEEPGKNHVKDCALMFRAVREKLGIETDC